MSQSFVLNVAVDDYDELQRVALITLESLVQINMDYLVHHPEAPSDPLSAGLWYDPPPLDFRTSIHPTCSIPVLLRRGRGKCDSIAAYDVASRRLAGQRAHVALDPQGMGLFHVISEVLTVNGWEQIDVSAMLPKYNQPNACSVNGTDEVCSC